MAFPMPPFNLNSNANSRSGDIFREGNEDMSSFTINYGSGSSNSSSSKTDGLPYWVWIAVGAAMALIVKRKG